MKDVSRIVKKHLNEESYTLYKSNKSGFGYNKPDDIVEELRYKLHQFCKDTNFNVKILKEQDDYLSLSLTFSNRHIAYINLFLNKSRIVVTWESISHMFNRITYELIYDNYDEIMEIINDAAAQYGFKVQNKD